MYRIRRARSEDKDKVLSFCTHTFNWGDYIDQVWDYWYNDANGRLLVAESGRGKRIAVSHVALCPGRKKIWLEGIRVHPAHRRLHLATSLIDAMISYGLRKGAGEAYAIVSKDNAASHQMMKKNGFKAISRWAYYAIAGKKDQQQSEERLARLIEIGDIWNYLKASKIYELSARSYVRSWHWYPLDHGELRNLITEKRVVVTGTPINGVAIIDKTGYWTRKDVLQIVYLDSISTSTIRNLISFAANKYKYERLQVVCQQNKKMLSTIENFQVQESEQFLLYRKAFTQ